MFSEQNYYLESRIRGYENKALVDPRNMINFPSNLRKNMRKLFENMEQKHEIRYVKSLIDPFHPESQGSRVPSMLPRDTATFSTFQQTEFSTPSVSSSSHLVISNFEIASDVQMVKMTVPDSAWLVAPTPFSIAYVSDYVSTEAKQGHEYKLDAILLGTYS